MFEISNFKNKCFTCIKVLMQGKLFQRCMHLLYCSVLSLGGNVNTRRMSKPDMGYIFHIKNQWNILVIENYYVNYHKYQNVMLLTCSETKWTLCIYSCLQSPPRENWFQYASRVYATASTLTYTILSLEREKKLIYGHKTFQNRTNRIQITTSMVWPIVSGIS